jgi:hypothetical protein
MLGVTEGADPNSIFIHKPATVGIEPVGDNDGVGVGLVPINGVILGLMLILGVILILGKGVSDGDTDTLIVGEGVILGATVLLGVILGVILGVTLGDILGVTEGADPNSTFIHKLSTVGIGPVGDNDGVILGLMLILGVILGDPAQTSNVATTPNVVT